MNDDILVRIGLTPEEAWVYSALLDGGPQTAGDLLKRNIPIKRGLLYKVLDRLGERGLVTTQKGETKTVFNPQSPDTLMALMEERESEIRNSRESLSAALPGLKAKYNLSTERPAIRFFEGVEGLRKMYEDKIESGAKELLFIRTARAESYRETFGTWFAHYLKRQTEAGIKVHALTVDDEYTNHDPAVDAARGVVRTWLRPEDYTAPVQIETYGDKVTIHSFGKEIFGVMIESAPIATAIREVIQLADRGAKALEVTHDHPPVKDEKRRQKELKTTG
jgi:sugar-specific transcriptional regulator TrmB